MFLGISSNLFFDKCKIAAVLVAISTASLLVPANAEPSNISSAPTNSEGSPGSAAAQKVLKSIADLVKDYFPKAKITTTGGSLHFEYKVHERMHPYSRRNVMSPDLDGILGDVEVKLGGPKDRIVGFLERPETVHSVLLMAPYSATDKAYLSTRLVFQPITPLDFMDSFKHLIGGYDQPGDGSDSASSTDSQPVLPAATAQETQTSLNQPASARPATAVSAPDVRLSNLQGVNGIGEKPGSIDINDDQQKNISKVNTPLSSPESVHTGEVASGSSAPMDKYTYPEGRFKVMLPGSPQVKYSGQAGMRMVDYLLTVPEGTFNVSYVILPETPPNLKTSQLLDNMSQSVVNSLKGLHTRQYPSTLQGYPGCQLEIAELANKAGQSARFRIYIVQNYIYIVGLAGRKDWLNSSNAKEFLDTFQVNIAPSGEQKAAQLRREMEHSRQASGRDQVRVRTQSQKDAERSRADWQFNRVR